MKRKPKHRELTLDQMLALPDPLPEYVCRFIPHADRFKLVNLYHLARTALCTLPIAEQSPWHRMRWSSEQYAKEHPGVSQTAAYKDLCGILDR